ncbi:MAG: tRNA pseudouridine(13) synthase TruD [Ectothiorhodospiraceae bacterium]
MSAAPPEPRLLPSALRPAHGFPVARARFRVWPEDFRVVERLGFCPDGDGEHWLVRIRKRGCTTPDAVRVVARAAGVAPRDVGYAGLKDRHAVTEQWLSVPVGGELMPGTVLGDVELLEVERHRRKLRTGALAGNRFVITLRDVSAAPERISRRLLAIALDGVPNYFGPQRFGFQGRNLDKALAYFEGRLRVRDRKLRGLLFSAARAELFNRVLSRRVAEGTWNRALPGELMMLDGRRSLFAAETEPADSLVRRLTLMNIHPTGPLPGRGGARPDADVAALEAAVLEEAPALMHGLVEHGLEGARRALRLHVSDLGWDFPAPGVVRVAMSLPAGAYATTVLGEVFELEREGLKD